MKCLMSQTDEKKGSLTTRKHARILTQTVNEINCTKINYFEANLLIKSQESNESSNPVAKL